MNKDFLFESDTFTTTIQGFEACAQMRVEIKLIPSDDHSGNFEIVDIFDEDNQVARKFSDFPEKEQNKMMESANLLADAYNYEAWLDGQIRFGEGA